MIKSAEEFVSLRTSERQEDYLRAATDAAPMEVWLDIVKRFPDMRIWVAHNKTVPGEILVTLAHDPNADVRCAVAMKNKLPADTMTILSDDSDESVRERIAYNKNTPREILQALASDRCERISTHARMRLELDAS